MWVGHRAIWISCRPCSTRNMSSTLTTALVGWAVRRARLQHQRGQYGDPQTALSSADRVKVGCLDA